MYANFDGDFRRRPQQNLAGASSKLTRQDVIQRAQQERLKRENERQKLRSTLCIQSYTRSYIARKNVKNELRIQFNNLKSNFKSGDNLEPLVVMILFFYSPSKDIDNLIWICQQILKQKEELLPLLLNNTLWSYRIQRILNLCVEALIVTKNKAILVRMLDIYLSESLCLNHEYSPIIIKFYISLAKKGFFVKMRDMLETSTKVESNPTLFNELCMFIIRAVTLITLKPQIGEEYTDLIFSKVCQSLLSQPFTESIKMIFIKYLVESKFPYLEFYQFLQSGKNDSYDKSVYLFYCVLKLVPPCTNENNLVSDYYMQAIASLSKNIRRKSKFDAIKRSHSNVLEIEEDDGMEVSIDRMYAVDADSILAECVEICNDEIFVNHILKCFSTLTTDELHEDSYMNSLSLLCFNLLMREDNSVQKYKLLYTLAFKPKFLKSMWIDQDNKNLLDSLRKGVNVIKEEHIPYVCRLTAFCELFTLLLTTLHDDEFWSTDLAGERQSGVTSMPFTPKELESICEYMKVLVDSLIELTVGAPRHTSSSSFANTQEHYLKFWFALYNSSVKLITNLHQKDARIRFCSENFWTKTNMFNFPADYHRIEQVAKVFTEIDVDDKPPVTICESRWIQVLCDLPFLLPFTSRVLLFRALVYRLHNQFQDPERTAFLLGPSISISVRRSHIYEDAYLKLQETDLRHKLRVQFVNAVGLEEPGIDGGGILREFLSDLLLTCMDPNRGYFKLNRSNLLYPNPNVHRVEPNFMKHYYFIGKMLGKALYENIQLELPLAEFFLTKLVSKKFDVDFHYLASLDQVMYKNMLFLKNYQGNIQDLGLDFTIVNEELGETKVDELKPNGSNIPVTSTNRIEYIHLLADYKMNKQIRQQCLAFKQGVNSVVDLSYLQIFSNKELQLIISGADYDVDINDLKEHTNYTGERTKDHPIIKAFWEIVESFTSTQKRQLLKFVTSCSRPPLLGFKELQPAFCIQLSDGADRLPTASTCMNLLKIPAIPDPGVLKDRLIYAISQGAGFELS